MQIPESMPTLSAGEDQETITKDRVLEILQPFEEGLLLLVDDEKKKEWLKSKRTELNDEDESLNQAHDILAQYAEKQVDALGLGEETPDILSSYFYVRGLIRYNMV